MSAITAALGQIDEIGGEGELDANAADPISFDLDAVADPIVLPDGKRIYPPLLFGEPIDRDRPPLASTPRTRLASRSFA